MPIIASTYKIGIPQADGKCFVEEWHTDSTGKVHYREYGPVGSIDHQVVMEAKAVQLGEQLAAEEAEALYGA